MKNCRNCKYLNFDTDALYYPDDMIEYGFLFCEQNKDEYIDTKTKSTRCPEWKEYKEED